MKTKNFDLGNGIGFKTISELQSAVEKFVLERKWELFHNPKDISLAISVESNELLNNFVWKTIENSERSCEDKVFKEKVSEEIADVIILCASLANYLNIDIGLIVSEKIKKNCIKYPIHSKDKDVNWR